MCCSTGIRCDYVKLQHGWFYDYKCQNHFSFVPFYESSQLMWLKTSKNYFLIINLQIIYFLLDFFTRHKKEGFKILVLFYNQSSSYRKEQNNFICYIKQIKTYETFSHFQNSNNYKKKKNIILLTILNC